MAELNGQSVNRGENLALNVPDVGVLLLFPLAADRRLSTLTTLGIIDKVELLKSNMKGNHDFRVWL